MTQKSGVWQKNPHTHYYQTRDVFFYHACKLNVKRSRNIEIMESSHCVWTLECNAHMWLVYINPKTRVYSLCGDWLGFRVRSVTGVGADSRGVSLRGFCLMHLKLTQFIWNVIMKHSADDASTWYYIIKCTTGVRPRWGLKMSSEEPRWRFLPLRLWGNTDPQTATEGFRRSIKIVWSTVSNAALLARWRPSNILKLWEGEGAIRCFLPPKTCD